MLENSNLQQQDGIKEDKYTFYYDILNAMYDVLMKHNEIIKPDSDEHKKTEKDKNKAILLKLTVKNDVMMYIMKNAQKASISLKF